MKSSRWAVTGKCARRQRWQKHGSWDSCSAKRRLSRRLFLPSKRQQSLAAGCSVRSGEQRAWKAPGLADHSPVSAQVRAVTDESCCDSISKKYASCLSPVRLLKGPFCIWVVVWFVWFFFLEKLLFSHCSCVAAWIFQADFPVSAWRVFAVRT